MNPSATVLLIACAIAVVALPRRWAPIPILIAACYITRAQGINLGPFSFTPVRILIVVGLARILVRREWLPQGLNGLDRLILAWGIWMVGSVVFHSEASTQVVYRLGLVCDGWGLYFLFRIFCPSGDELGRLFGIVAVLLMPIAVAMVVEQWTVHNAFAVLGGVPEVPAIRDGRVRAQGPFAHAILAGNIGAVTLPLMIGLWPLQRKLALLGGGACAAMIAASSSSGPIMSALFGIFALCWWPYRYRLHIPRRSAVVVYVLLMLVMKDAPYYLMARIDLAGGSTGWYRARLIESSIEHLNEWWLTGTDYTRHWMATGVPVSPNHADLTNHYIQSGVFGGLPLMLLFMLILWRGFTYVGRALRQRPEAPGHRQFVTWATGAALFGHAATCIAVSYFDQSIVFLYLTLAAASAVLPDGKVTLAANAAPKSDSSLVRKSSAVVTPVLRPRRPWPTKVKTPPGRVGRTPALRLQRPK